jgi:hypothetical protein
MMNFIKKATSIVMLIQFSLFSFLPTSSFAGTEDPMYQQYMLNQTNTSTTDPNAQPTSSTTNAIPSGSIDPGASIYPTTTTTTTMGDVQITSGTLKSTAPVTSGGVLVISTTSTTNALPTTTTPTTNSLPTTSTPTTNTPPTTGTPTNPDGTIPTNPDGTIPTPTAPPSPTTDPTQRLANVKVQTDFVTTETTADVTLVATVTLPPGTDLKPPVILTQDGYSPDWKPKLIFGYGQPNQWGQIPFPMITGVNESADSYTRTVDSRGNVIYQFTYTFRLTGLNPIDANNSGKYFYDVTLSSELMGYPVYDTNPFLYFVAYNSKAIDQPTQNWIQQERAVLPVTVVGGGYTFHPDTGRLQVSGQLSEKIRPGQELRAVLTGPNGFNTTVTVTSPETNGIYFTGFYPPVGSTLPPLPKSFDNYNLKLSLVNTATNAELSVKNVTISNPFPQPVATLNAMLLEGRNAFVSLSIANRPVSSLKAMMRVLYYMNGAWLPLDNDRAMNVAVDGNGNPYFSSEIQLANFNVPHRIIAWLLNNDANQTATTYQAETTLTATSQSVNIGDVATSTPVVNENGTRFEISAYANRIPGVNTQIEVSFVPPGKTETDRVRLILNRNSDSMRARYSIEYNTDYIWPTGIHTVDLRFRAILDTGTLSQEITVPYTFTISRVDDPLEIVITGADSAEQIQAKLARATARTTIIIDGVVNYWSPTDAKLTVASGAKILGRNGGAIITGNTRDAGRNPFAPLNGVTIENLKLVFSDTFKVGDNNKFINVQTENAHWEVGANNLISKSFIKGFVFLTKGFNKLSETVVHIPDSNQTSYPSRATSIRFDGAGITTFVGAVITEAGNQIFERVTFVNEINRLPIQTSDPHGGATLGNKIEGVGLLIRPTNSFWQNATTGIEIDSSLFVGLHSALIQGTYFGTVSLTTAQKPKVSYSNMTYVSGPQGSSSAEEKNFVFGEEVASSSSIHILFANAQAGDFRLTPDSYGVAKGNPRYGTPRVNIGALGTFTDGVQVLPSVVVNASSMFVSTNYNRQLAQDTFIDDFLINVKRFDSSIAAQVLALIPADFNPQQERLSFLFAQNGPNGTNPSSYIIAVSRINNLSGVVGSGKALVRVNNGFGLVNYTLNFTGEVQEARFLADGQLLVKTRTNQPLAGDIYAIRNGNLVLTARAQTRTIDVASLNDPYAPLATENEVKQVAALMVTTLNGVKVYLRTGALPNGGRAYYLVQSDGLVRTFILNSSDVQGVPRIYQTSNNFLIIGPTNPTTIPIKFVGVPTTRTGRTQNLTFNLPIAFQPVLATTLFSVNFLPGSHTQFIMSADHIATGRSYQQTYNLGGGTGVNGIWNPSLWVQTNYQLVSTAPDGTQVRKQPQPIEIGNQVFYRLAVVRPNGTVYFYVVSASDFPNLNPLAINNTAAVLGPTNSAPQLNFKVLALPLDGSDLQVRTVNLPSTFSGYLSDLSITVSFISNRSFRVSVRPRRAISPLHNQTYMI